MQEIKRVQFFTKTDIRGDDIGSLGLGNNFFVGDFSPKLIIEKIELENELVKIHIKDRKNETIEVHEYHGFPFKIIYSN